MPALEELAELIVSLSFPEDPRIAPDGRQVAYVATPYGRAKDAEGAIWLAPLDGGAPARQVTRGQGRDERPRWSPDGRGLAFLSERAKPGVAALYRMPHDGGEAEPLVERKRGIASFAWSPDGRRIAFLAPDEPTEEDERRERERDDAEVYGEDWKPARLHLLDLASGEVSTLPTAQSHLAELAWSPDGARIAFIAWRTPELESALRARIATIVVDHPAQQTTVVDEANGWSAHRLTWSDDGSRLLFIGSHDPLPQASFTLYAVDAAGGTPHVLGPSAADECCVVGLEPVPGAGRVVISVAEGLSTRLEWVDTASGARELLYAPEDGDLGPFDVRVVAGAVKLAVVQSSGNQPPELYGGQLGALRPLSQHHAALREFEFGRQEPFFWTAPDGLPLDGVLIRPPHAPDGPLPLVVLVHGGPYGRSANGWNLRPLNWAQWLAAHGYAVLMPNYRGGLGHGNTFAMHARGNVGEGDFPDVLSGVDAAIERGIADPARLGIGGWSQGGFMTAWAVTQTSRFKAGVMGAGVSDWGMMTMTSDMSTFEAALGGDRPWDGPGPHRAAAISPISYAGRAETPLLMLHGKNDERVPVTQAIGFERALRERGVPTQLVVYPREPHGVRERAHQRDILRRVIAWYDRWLK
ncbi:MAG TPA: S9 family peptidase [Thermomicrobiaceae bacterium]|nr:S9 family peptidase [Thermomicrobiaceae bacterium]